MPNKKAQQEVQNMFPVNMYDVCAQSDLTYSLSKNKYYWNKVNG